MARPREHDLDTLLDHARAIWADEGPSALTIRSLSAASGVSNGAIYHAFGSRGALLAAVWIREADAFIRLQRDARLSAREEGGSPEDAVVAAALAPDAYAAASPDGARLLLGTSARELADGADVSQQRALRRHRREIRDLVERLADDLWGRGDENALSVVQRCVVDLPGALLLQPHQDPALSRHVLASAVRGVLASEPPAPGAPG